jgi:hypothetical protein
VLFQGLEDHDMIARNSAGVPLTHSGRLWSKVLDALVGSPAQGDILYRSATAWTRLAPGTNGNVLRTNGAGSNPSWGAGSAASGGAMSYVGGHVVSGGAVTTFSVSGLDLDAHEEYYIRYNIDNNSGGNSVVVLTYNADTTTANYDREIHLASAGTSNSSGGNTPSITGAGLSAGEQMCGRAWIRRNFDGFVCGFGHNNQIDTTPNRVFMTWTHLWRTASTNVTSMAIAASAANSISNGSYLHVWKINSQ